MPIDFCDLLSDDDWAPYTIDPSASSEHWAAGGPLADAPVDVDASLDGAIQRSTMVDPAFNAFGMRYRPGFVMPRRHHNLRQLVIVFGGEVTVHWGADGEEGSETFHLGEFWQTDAETPYTFTAGDEGVVVVESWSAPIAELETWWHDAGWTPVGCSTS